MLLWLVALFGGLWSAQAGSAPSERVVAEATATPVGTRGDASLELASRPAAGHVEAPAANTGLAVSVSRGSKPPRRESTPVAWLAGTSGHERHATPTSAAQTRTRAQAVAAHGGVLPYDATAPPAGR